MWHLALETIGLSGSVALFNNTQLITNFPLPDQIGSARSLLPAIQSVVRQAAITSSDLNLISLANGPGSFTGLRVSVATAKAIGYALSIPLCAVDTLETLAYRLAGSALHLQRKPTLVSVAMDAYRKQVFRLVARVDPLPSNDSAQTSPFKLQVVLPSHHLDVSLWKQNPFHGIPKFADLDLHCDQQGVIMGSAQYSLVIGGNAITRYPLQSSFLEQLTACDPKDITAEDVGKYAGVKWLAGERTDPFRLLPNYLRASAAEEKAAASSITHSDLI